MTGCPVELQFYPADIEKLIDDLRADERRHIHDFFSFGGLFRIFAESINAILVSAKTTVIEFRPVDFGAIIATAVLSE